MILERGGERGCALCGRTGEKLTEHHLVPRCRVRKGRRRRKSRDQMKQLAASDDATVMLCQPCHHMIHATLSEKELARHYSSVEALVEHPEIARFVAWVRGKEPGRVSVRWTHQRRSAGERRRRRR
jgi:hypothetical protein